MKKYFITYGDALFEDAKRRIIAEAKQTGEFDYIIAYDHTQVTEKLKQSDIFAIKRGGGLWSWKPDVIWQTLNKMNDGDFLVYCDSGCELQACREWKWFWGILSSYDIIAQRIFQHTENWTRFEVMTEFKDNGIFWPKMFQFQATIILKKSDFTVEFIRQWRDLMINNPILAMDVTKEERLRQHPAFKENRHDQSIYSALIYKYLKDIHTKNKIYTMWEHIEDIDIFKKQAIRASRRRTNQIPSKKNLLLSVIKRLIKDFIYKPLYIVPQHVWFLLRNNMFKL